MSLRAIIFDLDGTLVDSAAHCAAIINRMLADRGSDRRLTRDEATPHMSLGGEQLITGLLGGEGGDPADDLADFRVRYAALETPEDCLFPGVRTGVTALADAGFGLGICSNKPLHLCEKIVVELGLTAVFTSIVGAIADRPSKPDPAMLMVNLRDLGVDAGEAILIGDSWVDAALCKAASVPFWFVTYGYPGVPEPPASERSFDDFAMVVDALLEGRGSA